MERQSDDVKDMIKKEFKERTSLIALTTDIWSDTAVSSYVGVTAHFFDAKMTFQSRFLGLKKLPLSHSGEIVREKIDKLLEEYGLTNADISKIVTDGASNMVKAFKEEMICKFWVKYSLWLTVLFSYSTI